MANERQNWLTKPAHLVRAARHYEGAAQILIRHAVMSARQVRLMSNCCNIILCELFQFFSFIRFKLTVEKVQPSGYKQGEISQ